MASIRLVTEIPGPLRPGGEELVAGRNGPGDPCAAALRERT